MPPLLPPVRVEAVPLLLCETPPARQFLPVGCRRECHSHETKPLDGKTDRYLFAIDKNLLSGVLHLR